MWSGVVERTRSTPTKANVGPSSPLATHPFVLDAVDKLSKFPPASEVARHPPQLTKGVRDPSPAPPGNVVPVVSIWPANRSPSPENPAWACRVSQPSERHSAPSATNLHGAATYVPVRPYLRKGDERQTGYKHDTGEVFLD